MTLSDEAVATFVWGIGNNAQAIAKRKRIPEGRQTYGCSALTSACAAPVPVTTPDFSRSRRPVGEQKTVVIVDDHLMLRREAVVPRLAEEVLRARADLTPR